MQNWILRYSSITFCIWLNTRAKWWRINDIKEICLIWNMKQQETTPAWPQSPGPPSPSTVKGPVWLFHATAWFLLVAEEPFAFFMSQQQETTSPDTTWSWNSLQFFTQPFEHHQLPPTHQLVLDNWEVSLIIPANLQQSQAIGMSVFFSRLRPVVYQGSWG